MNTNLLRGIDKNVGVSMIRLGGGLKSKKTAPKNPKRILLIKLFGFGNFIFLSPTIKQIKSMFPHADIDVLTFSQNRQICEMYDGLISNVHIMKFSGMRIFYETARFIVKNRRKYDIVIDLEQFIRFSAIIGKSIKPRYFIGISTKNSRKSSIFDHNIEYKEDKHIVEEYYRTALFLAKTYHKKIPENNITLVRPSTKKSALCKRTLSKIPKGYLKIGICIGGREENKEKRYPDEYYAEVLDLIESRHDTCMMFFGSKSEYAEADEIISRSCHGNCINLCGKVSLAESAELISHMDLFISNDTGPIHLAAALETFCVGIYGPTPEKIYGPYTKRCLILRDKHKPVISSHTEKNLSWNTKWWPDPKNVYRNIENVLKKMEK